MQPRIVEVRRNILRKNDVLAGQLRRRFEGAGIFTTSLVSSPGAGKTAFLKVLEVPAGTDAGFDAWITLLEARCLAMSGAVSRARSHRTGAEQRARA